MNKINIMFKNIRYSNLFYSDISIKRIGHKQLKGKHVLIDIIDTDMINFDSKLNKIIELLRIYIKNYDCKTFNLSLTKESENFLILHCYKITGTKINIEKLPVLNFILSETITPSETNLFFTEEPIKYFPINVNLKIPEGLKPNYDIFKPAIGFFQNVFNKNLKYSNERFPSVEYFYKNYKIIAEMDSNNEIVFYLEGITELISTRKMNDIINHFKAQKERLEIKENEGNNIVFKKLELSMYIFDLETFIDIKDFNNKVLRIQALIHEIHSLKENKSIFDFDRKD